MTQRRTWAFATGLLAGYCGLAAATGVAVAVGGTRRPGLALAILAVAALLLATRTRAAATAGLGVMAWLFYAGFIAGRHGDLAWQSALAWHDVAGGWRLGVLVASAEVGWLFSWLAARAHRETSASGQNAGTARQNAVAGGQLASVISLTEARASRHG
jgi:hypothetical protein